MRKLLLGLVFIILTVFPATAAQQIATFEIDLQECIVHITLQEMREGLKVLVDRDDGRRYCYDMLKQQETFPLQMGPGEYRLSVLEHIEGVRYKYIQSVYCTIDTSGYSFLASIQNVPWKEALIAITKAHELTKNTDSTADKIRAIHDYLTTNIRYDFRMLGFPGRIPNPDETLQTGRGVCYDYAVTTATMLRSVGVPCKLVFGRVDGYVEMHAWNEVWVNREWMIMDTTFNVAYGEMSKKKGYRKEKEY